ncbi:hypothetical protein [Amycolatopsis methanolica]|uniref:Uncharacterized protein n=1 Tax=Amycolatopsis methanolica 239 TaxID=1068978 RepID=A0A076N550_AMYME|nr:hypothetical protein [Amycolatopsis methanolica]AIJ26382.1 hypothetical protein AMETH_6290 [Amycolatopsis methanolica 239]AIJ26441.1 hypothetical protein AMETH_6349 [Amycolatopsis methanolica 239]
MTEKSKMAGPRASAIALRAYAENWAAGRVPEPSAAKVADLAGKILAELERLHANCLQYRQEAVEDRGRLMATRRERDDLQARIDAALARLDRDEAEFEDGRDPDPADLIRDLRAALTHQETPR